MKLTKSVVECLPTPFGDWRKRPLLDITGDLVGKRHAVLGEQYGKAWANLSNACPAGALQLRGPRTTRWVVRRWSWTTRSNACHGRAPGSASTVARR
jgi:hypothetical protein